MKKTHSDKKPYQCPHCEKTYTRFLTLRTHVHKKHPEEYEQFEESLKLEQSETEDLSKDENNNQSAETRHACPYCTNTYKYQKTLQNHIDKKHADKPQIWKNIFRIMATLKPCWYVKDSSNLIYFFKYQKTLQNHINNKHPDSRRIQENDPQIEEWFSCLAFKYNMKIGCDRMYLKFETVLKN